MKSYEKIWGKNFFFIKTLVISPLSNIVKNHNGLKIGQVIHYNGHEHSLISVNMTIAMNYNGPDPVQYWKIGLVKNNNGPADKYCK